MLCTRKRPYTRVTKFVLLKTKWRRLYKTRWKKDKTIKFIYPNVKRTESVVDDYHGTQVSDPYRWLEHHSSGEVKDFINKQCKVTRNFLSNCCEREYMQKRFADLHDYPKYSCPFKRGNHYYYFYRRSVDPETVLYQQDSLRGKARKFLDLNITSTGVSYLTSFSFSENGSIFCYSLSSGGSDWLTIHFKNVDTLHEYDDRLERVKFTTISWTHDHLGIFYSCYPKGHKASGFETAQVLNQKIHYHRLGTPQDEDAVIAEFPEHPTWNVKASVSHCGNYLIIYPWKYSGYNGLFFCNLTPHLKVGISYRIKKFDVTPVFTDVSNYFFEYVTNIGTVFYFRTCRNAANSRIVTIDFDQPDENNWKVHIPEDKNDVLEWTQVVSKNILVTCYTRNVKSTLKIFTFPGAELLKEYDLELGSITCRSGKLQDSVFFFRIETIFSPTKLYYIDCQTTELELKLFREIPPPWFKTSECTYKQVFYSSKDGTLIPMYIIHKKDLVLDGNNFCRLYGYGGFGFNNFPSYAPQRAFILENMDGLDAIANIRGGGEFGEKWHKAGVQSDKQKSFDDFQAAAEYLIDNKYTSKSKLAIAGSSNGGLLIGVCVNQRPDLFGAAVPSVGVMDMLRFHKFTTGGCWLNEFGISDIKEDFETLYKYSPLHNVNPPPNQQQYPPVLVMTAENDNRVVPSHSLKYVAELQHTIGKLPYQTNPFLLRVDTKAGHGSGKGHSAMQRDNRRV